MSVTLKGLQELRKKVASLKVVDLAAVAGEVVDAKVAETFDKTREPEGQPWARRIDPGDGHPLLDDTGKLKSGMGVRVAEGSVTITAKADYAAAVNAKRSFVPKGGLPADWKREIDAGVAEALKEHFES